MISIPRAPQVVFSGKVGKEQIDRVLSFVGSFIIKFNEDNETVTKTVVTVYWQTLYCNDVLAANIPMYVLAIVPKEELNDLKLENTKTFRMDKVSVYPDRIEFIVKDSGCGLFFAKIYKNPVKEVNLLRPDWFLKEIHSKEERDIL